jgi:hypothetical protein
MDARADTILAKRRWVLERQASEEFGDGDGATTRHRK